ncbi:MAG: hypothetical protein FWF92_08395 [Oscillospiraceae bacterium]|nr:hypothetical protein [Oscillospiraceae bacterium]
MDNQIKIFKNEDFGELEILLIDNAPYFPATDSTKMLGYKNPHDAISTHCRKEGVVKREGVSFTVNQHGTKTEQVVEKTYISEGNL